MRNVTPSRDGANFKTPPSGAPVSLGASFLSRPCVRSRYYYLQGYQSSNDCIVVAVAVVVPAAAVAVVVSLRKRFLKKDLIDFVRIAVKRYCVDCRLTET